MDERLRKLRDFNYWDGKTVDLGLTRSFYIEKIDEFREQNLVKILVGQKRTGKSFILRQIIGKLLEELPDPRNIFYLNKEFLALDRIENTNELERLFQTYITEIRPAGKIYIFLDEVQEIDKWETFVNTYAPSIDRDYEIFVSGSNSQILSETKLTVPFIVFDILPYSYDEYLRFHKYEKNRQTLLDYLYTGGLPELFHLPNEESRRHYIISLKDTIMLRDVVQRHKIKNADLLQRIFLYIATNLGNLYSATTIVKHLKTQNISTNFDTVCDYIGYLKDAYLIHEVRRIDIKRNEILSGNRKFYLNDLSYRKYLTSYIHFNSTKFLENLAYLHFKRAGYKIYTGKWGEYKIDFVIKKEENTKYFRVLETLTEEKKREEAFKALEAIRDSYEKAIITLDDSPSGNRKGIRHKPILEMF